ncbi:testis-specific gene 13 protein [Tiliqua scincoides]|uniref:testis-specific gene 13 protein n=1 Tax=Tiliqua scincoides TaxID=71010 RepID=UPI003461A06C
MGIPVIIIIIKHTMLKVLRQQKASIYVIQYFIPLTDAEFQERLEKHRGEIAIMLKSSEFNQDKTTLIVTNNPLPLLISGQQLATRFQFFSKDLLETSCGWESMVFEQNKLFCHTCRFATDKDFKTEAQFSKGYAERRLQKMYPHLCTHTNLAAKKREPLPRIEGWSPKISHWEPLTLSCLTEIRPTLIAPGDNGFRYGKAPLWVINSSVVPRNIK